MRYAKEERCQKAGGTGVKTAGFLVAVMYIIAVTGVAVCALSFARGAGAAENEVIEIAYDIKEEENSPLTNLLGKTECGNMGESTYEDKQKIDKAELITPQSTEKGYKFLIDTNGYTVFKAIEFGEVLNAGEISGIEIEVKAEYGANTIYGSEDEPIKYSTVGIVALGVEGDGSSGVVLDPYIKNGEWAVWNIDGREKDKLAGEDGVIRGIRIAAGIDTLSWDEEETISLEIRKISVIKASGYRVTFVSESGERGIIAEGTVTLPDISEFWQESTGAFVGWTTDEEGLADLYTAGEQAEITEEKTFYAVTADFSMTEGGYIRRMSEPEENGLRFEAVISKEDYLKVEKYVVSKGIIISPAEYWEEEDFTLENASKEKPVLSAAVAKGEWREEGNELKYSGTLTGVNPGNYSIEYGGRGYIEIESSGGIRKRIYTGYDREKNARSMYGIALKHADAEEVKSYLDGVADAEITGIGYYILRDGSEGYLHINGTDSVIESASEVYSLIVNGKRLSLTAKTPVDIEGTIYEITVKGIEYTAAGSRITISMSPRVKEKAI